MTSRLLYILRYNKAIKETKWSLYYLDEYGKITKMKKLIKNIGKDRNVIFLDLEGTQFSHELIAIGAFKVKIKKDSTFAKLDKGFQVYVHPKNQIGRFVEKLTGINQELLTKEAISYVEAMAKFKKYVGRDFKKAKFVTFGNHDIRIFSQSESISGPSDPDFFLAIKSNHVDLSKILSEYAKDDKNNPLSLTNYCKLFNVTMAGTNHEALSDARNLAQLYNAIIKNPHIVADEYKKVLENGKGMPRPIQKLMKKLREDGNVDSLDFERFIREEIRDEKTK